MWSIRLALVLCILSCASQAKQNTATTPTDTPTSKPTPAITGFYAGVDFVEISRQVAALRGLPLKEPISVALLDTSEFQQRYQSHQRYLLGESETPLGTGLLEAFYDVQNREIVLRRTVDDWTKQNENPVGLFAHEVVHALQHQHFDIFDHLRKEKGIDRIRAMSALIEGDAQITRVAFEAKGKNQNPRRMVLDEIYLVEEFGTGLITGVTPPSMAHLPAITRAVEYFQYRWGAYFVGRFYLHGGWELVNELYSYLPHTTADVMEPSRYLQGSKGREYPNFPLPKGLTPEGRVGPVGRLGTEGLLETWGVAPAESRQLASYWEADRLVNFKDTARNAGFVWLLRFRDEPSAKGFETLVKGKFGDDVSVQRKGLAVSVVIYTQNKSLAKRLAQQALADAGRPIERKGAAGKLQAVELGALPTRPMERPDFYAHIVDDKLLDAPAFGFEIPIPQNWKGQLPRHHGIQVLISNGANGFGVISIAEQSPTEENLNGYREGVWVGVPQYGTPSPGKIRPVNTPFGPGQLVSATFAQSPLRIQVITIPICKNQAFMAFVLGAPHLGADVFYELQGWMKSAKVAPTADESAFCQAIFDI